MTSVKTDVVSVCNEEKKKVNKSNPYNDTHFFDRFFSFWILPFLCQNCCRTLKVEDIPEIPRMYDTRRVHFKFDKHFQKVKKTKNPLLFTLIRFIWKELLVFEVINIVNLSLLLASPFLQRVILEHIFPADDTEEWILWGGTGYLFVGLLFLVQVARVYLTKMSMEIAKHITQLVMSSLFAKVYDKLLRFSPKSMNEMNNESFVTYMSVEIGLVIVLPHSLMMLYKQPILLVASIVLLFVNLSWPAFFIIVVVVVLVPIYLFLSTFLLLIFLPLLKLFNENTKFKENVLKGIRVIKTNVWEKVFLEKVMSRRKRFVRFIVCYFVLGVLFFITYMLSPIIMQLVLFVVTFTFQEENFTIAKIFPSLTYITLFSMAVTAFPALIIASGKGFLALHRVGNILKKEEFDRNEYYSTPKEDDVEEEEEEGGEEKEEEDEGEEVDEEVKDEEEEEEDDDDDEEEEGCFYPLRIWNSNFRFYEKPDDSNKFTSKVKRKMMKVAGQMKDCVCKKKKKKDEDNIEETELEEVEEKKKKIGVLENIDLKIREGDLVAIIGEVGSGKSMLLKSFVGGLKKGEEGHVSVISPGKRDEVTKISYCPQEPWVINETCEQNILFGKELDEEKLERVIDACDLQKDLDVFPKGLKTEVGERGGQKQRIALARGFYYDADIYILDDISSSVDSGVARSIFEKGILGIVGEKTRVLVTNELSWLARSDYIIALEEGRVREEGKFDDLMDIENGFVKYLVEKFTAVQENRISSGTGKKEMEASDEDEGEEEEIEIGKEDSQEVIEIHHDDNNEEEKKKNSLVMSEVNLVDSTTATTTEKTKKKEEDAKISSQPLMLEEEVNVGQVSCKTVWFYFRTFGCCSWACSAVVTLLFLSFLTIFDFLYKQMLSIWLSFWASDYLSLNSNTYLIVYASIGLTRPLVSTLRYFLLVVFSLCSGVRITRKVFIRLFKTPVSYWERTPLGRVMNRLSGDQFKTDFLIVPLEGFVWAILELVFSFITVGITNWMTLIVFIVFVPIYIAVQEFYRRSSRQLRRILAVSRSPMMSIVQESIDGIQIIRTYNAEDHFFSRFCEKVNYNGKVRFMSFQLDIWLNYVLGSLSAVIILISGLLIVAFNDIAGSGMTVLAGLSLSHLLALSERLSWAVHEVVNIEQTFNSVERLSYYANDLEVEKPEFVKENRPPNNWASDSDKIEISFKDISMRYRDDLPLVLRNLNFRVRSKEKIGIVGRTGAGKTSLFNCLFRIVEPCGGQITIDGINVTENFGIHDLRNILSIIPQDPYLFKGTVRFNLDPSGSIKKDAELWDVLEKCRLKRTVQAYKKKLDHKIEGNKISAGERQLFCLARSLIRKTKILCLDEATANIDLETETYIRDTIDNEFKDCIVFTIAHRIHTIATSDRLTKDYVWSSLPSLLYFNRMNLESITKRIRSLCVVKLCEKIYFIFQINQSRPKYT